MKIPHISKKDGTDRPLFMVELNEYNEHAVDAFKELGNYHGVEFILHSGEVKTIKRLK